MLESNSHYSEVDDDYYYYYYEGGRSLLLLYNKCGIYCHWCLGGWLVAWMAITHCVCGGVRDSQHRHVCFSVKYTISPQV